MNHKPFVTTELKPLPDAVQELIAERDEWKARCEFSFEQRDALTAELELARMAPYVAAMSEIAKERDALKDAARMALDVLIEIRDNGFSWDAEYDKTIEALKKAGVTP